MSVSPLASRMAAIAPFRVMAILKRARELEAQGRSIVHMEIGEPDFSSAEPIVRAGQLALEQGQTYYTPPAGLPELRSAISEFYARRYGVSVAPERIIVTPGASGALQLVLSVLVGPGDEVLMSDPGYPCNRNFVRLCEGVPVEISVDADSDYQLSAAVCAARWRKRTVAALVASPANPTGAVLSLANLQQLQSCVSRNNGRLIVDEIYHGLTYDIDAPTVLAVTDQAFVVNSFSKYFGMTGWRLGWLVAPHEYVEPLEMLAGNLFLAPSTIAQHAALAAFSDETLSVLEKRRAEFKMRRDYLLPALRQLGFTVANEPAGAFYIYASCEKWSADSEQFCRDLLDQAGVAIAPGTDFAQDAAATHVRFAYTTSLAQLREGVRRIAQWLPH